MPLQNTAAGLSYSTFIPANFYDASISPLIFLHGMTRSKETWKTIPQSIADGTKRKAFVIDSPNHGDSKWNDILNLNQDSQDVLLFMDALDIQKAIIIGHSMGGIVAMLVALMSPKRVESVIIEDCCFQSANCVNSMATVDYIKKMDDAFRGTSSEMSEYEVKCHVIDYMQITQKSGTVYNNQYVSYETFLPIRRSSDGRYMAKHNSRALTKGLENAGSLLSIPNETFNGPAFFIYGEISALNVLDHKQDILKNFPAAKFIEMKQAGHEMHFSFPNEFIQIAMSCL